MFRLFLFHEKASSLSLFHAPDKSAPIREAELKKHNTPAEKFEEWP
jgi:hypothetical protein